MVRVYLMWNPFNLKPPMHLWRLYGFMILRNPQSVANPETALDHPLELMMHGANHGGLWRVAYLARTALPFAVLYGFADREIAREKVLGLFKKRNCIGSISVRTFVKASTW